MSSETLYQNAIDNPSLRQDFLNGIDLEDAAKHVKSVKYKRFPKIRGLYSDVTPYLMICKSPRPIFLFLGLKSKIEVYNKAFNRETFPIVNDFLSALIDHEGYHARENSAFYKSLKSISVFDDSFESKRLLLNLDSELGAHTSQILNAQKRGVSNNYLEGLKEFNKRAKEERKNLEKIVSERNHESISAMVSSIGAIIRIRELL